MKVATRNRTQSQTRDVTEMRARALRQRGRLRRKAGKLDLAKVSPLLSPSELVRLFVLRRAGAEEPELDRKVVQYVNSWFGFVLANREDMFIGPVTASGREGSMVPRIFLIVSG